MKINKVLPPFYGGISEQGDVLILDNQVRDMENFIPSLVSGAVKRPGISDVANLVGTQYASNCFHHYERGITENKYMFVLSATNTLQVYRVTPLGVATLINTISNSYFGSTASVLRALTVQDTTFIVNTSLTVAQTITSALDSNYDKVGYYWLKRSSNDSTNPYTYAIYINGITYQASDKSSDVAALSLATAINTGVGKLSKTGVIGEGNTHTLQLPIAGCTIATPTVSGCKQYSSYSISGNILTITTTDVATPAGSTYFINVTYTLPVQAFTAEAKGSVIKISGTIPSFSTWDSWGNQASKGWMGTVRRITDLPDMMPTFSSGSTPYVKVGQASESGGIPYYVKWNGSSWEECKSPTDTRGTISTNTPFKIVIDDNTGTVVSSSQLSLYAPKVGDTDTNPNPSFVGKALQDILFFKNRLGFCSQDNVILSETGNYDNFYATSILDILETDPIDVAIAGNTASKIYYAIPFQRGLYLFTQDAQFELIGDGGNFTPTTVSIVPVSNYVMDVAVKPVTSGTSLYFIASSGNNVNQLREFVINNDTLVANGIDLTLSTPSLLPKIKQIAVSTLNSMVLLSAVNSNYLYCYKFAEDGKERLQSAWTKLKYPVGAIHYHFITDDELFLVTTNTSNNRSVLSKCSLNIDVDSVTVTQDTYLAVVNQIEASIKLPRWIPKVGNIKNTANKLIVKSLTGLSVGSPYVKLYNNKYNTTHIQNYTGSTNRLQDKRASILIPSTDVEIWLMHNTNEYCSINSVVLDGLYKITSKELN